MNDFATKARHEFKYLLPLPVTETVKSRLSPLLSTDSHYQDRDYLVRSMYFDDTASSAYYEKMSGVEKRQKIRIRYYDLDTGYIILEKKIKKGNMVMKRSSRITESIAKILISGDFSPLLFEKDPFLRELYGELTSEGYIPVVGVDYRRTAFVMPGTDIRVTVDENVSAFPPAGGFFTGDPPSIPAYSNMAVLEVKFGRYLPEFISIALADLPLQKEAFSKFAICRELVSDPCL